MAKNIKLECRINDIKQVPNSRTYIISVRYKQGKKDWSKAWRFTPEKPVSMEWLEREIAKLDPWPEADLMQNVLEEKDKVFTIEVEPVVSEKLAGDIADTVEQHAPPVQRQQITVPPGTMLE